MQNGINPVVSMSINIILAVLGVIAGSAAQLTTLFGTSTAQSVISAVGFAVAIFGAVNTALHNYSSTVAGPGVVRK
jgi:hypothetical protein